MTLMSSEADRQQEALRVYWSQQPPEFWSRFHSAWLIRPTDGAWLTALPPHWQWAIRQTDRRLAAPFLARGFDPLAPPPEAVDLAVVFATKHREEVLANIAEALQVLREDGVLLVSAANDLGAVSLERQLVAVAGSSSAFSKQKCRVLRVDKARHRLNWALLTGWIERGRLSRQAETGLYASPGLFSWKAPDQGSRQLAAFLPRDLKGRGADFGAGYGFLTRAVLERNPGVTHMSLMDIEWKALKAAEKGLTDFVEVSGCSAQLTYEWQDLLGSEIPLNLDFVVTNPPFHQQREALPKLGQAFLRTALAALKPGGRLLMVANRHLPYEAILEAAGARIVRSGGVAGFKLIEALAEGARR